VVFFLGFWSAALEELACGAFSILVFILFLAEKLSNSSWAEMTSAALDEGALGGKALIPAGDGVGDSFKTRTLCALRV